MKLGADPKQVKILGAILCLAAILYWANRPDSPENDARSQASRKMTAGNSSAAAIPPVRQQVGAKQTNSRRTGTKSSLQDFKPSLKPRKEAIDPATVDPSLRLDLLAKVQRVNLAGGSRSLFDFGAAPIVKAPTPPPIDPTKNSKLNGAVAATVAALTNPTPPQPPVVPKTPIPLKFFGFLGGARQASKRAFFLEGEEIYVAGEGDLIRKRFKVIRIGLNSAVVEDTQQSYEQTLPLEEAQQGT